MSNKIVITIEVPDGVVPTVDYQQAASPAQPSSGSGASVCPDHHKPYRMGKKGPYCPTKVGDDWCDQPR